MRNPPRRKRDRFGRAGKKARARRLKLSTMRRSGQIAVRTGWLR